MIEQKMYEKNTKKRIDRVRESDATEYGEREWN
jgi:hypothetical protein